MNVKSARNAKEFIRVLTRDEQGRIIKAIVPGHEARQYTVTISRGKVVSVRCVLNQEQAGDELHDCTGNSNGHICYHCLAALLLAGEDSQVELAENEREATRKAIALRGKAVPVYSDQGSGSVWVVFPHKRTQSGRERKIEQTIREIGDEIRSQYKKCPDSF